MTRFLDGPAANVVLQLKRAPLYLRVTQSAEGEFDALDQLDDAPREDEQVCVYRREGKAGWCHLDYRDKRGRRRGETFTTADYRQHAEQPGDDVLRDTARWRAWATDQAAKARADG